MPAGSKAYRALRSVAEGWTRLDALLQRVSSAGRDALGGLLSEALDADEQSDLGPRLYDARAMVHEGLQPWEERWFAECLPKAPAAILIGGAGDGREARALAERGYRVAAFDPRMEGMARCRSTLAADALVVCADYESLSAAVLDGADNDASMLATRTYDAALLGWGSFGHVLDPEERERLVIAVDRLSPNGPILASFLSSNEDGGSVRPGRTERVGRRAGRMLGSWRGVIPRSGTVFAPHFGFAEPLGRDEIERLGKTVGREVAWVSSPYPHVTWPATRASGHPSHLGA